MIMPATHFFLPAPIVRLTVGHMHCFEQILETARHADGLAHYNCPYPKFEFLFYLTQRKHYLLHGSPRANIGRFEPPRPVAALDHSVAVYATDHEISAMFAAVRPDSRLTLSGYFWARDDYNRPNPFYDFSFQAGGRSLGAWSAGVIYVLPRAAFDPWGSEWASRGAVTPLLKLPVLPEDFPLLSAIQRHEAQLTGEALPAGGFVAAFDSDHSAPHAAV